MPKPENPPIKKKRNHRESNDDETAADQKSKSGFRAWESRPQNTQPQKTTRTTEKQKTTQSLRGSAKWQSQEFSLPHLPLEGAYSQIGRCIIGMTIKNDPQWWLDTCPDYCNDEIK